jgi:hypothetical protein
VLQPLDHLDQAIAALEIKLSEDEIKQLEDHPVLEGVGTTSSRSTQGEVVSTKSRGKITA